MEYVCKLYLFTPMNFLIQIWYRLLLCIHNYSHVQYHLHILSVNGLHFCVWNHVLPAGHMLYIFICKYNWTILYSGTYNISRSDCRKGTSKYVIPFLLLWWIHVIIVDDPCKMYLYLSKALVLFSGVFYLVLLSHHDIWSSFFNPALI